MLRLGIVALGRWGRRLVDSVQGEGVAPSGVVRFAKAYVRTPARHADYLASRGLEAAASYEALLADPAIDAVVLATPHSGHAREIVQAAVARRPVFCEKPLTLTRRDAAQAFEACSTAGVPLAVGFNRRFVPAYVEMKRLLVSGELGTPLHVEGNHSGFFGFSYDESDWHANPADTPAGGLTLMGIHLLDAMIGLIGPIDSVAAISLRQVLKVPLDDTTSGMLRFRGGQSGYVSTMTATARQVRLQLYGTKGWAHMLDHHVLEICMNGEAPRRTEFPAVDAERREMEAFAAMVAEGRPWPVSPDEAINGIAALEAFTISTKRDGSWVAAK